MASLAQVSLSGLATLVLALSSGACVTSTEDPDVVKSAPDGFRSPASLMPIGVGYPKIGEPCRMLGETPATANYLGDSERLIGCPGAPGGAAVRTLVDERQGRVVGEVDGVTLISVPER